MSEKRVVSHPGEYLIDSIEALGMTQNEFAIRTDISTKTISNLINGKANITFEIASKLASFFGNSVEFWINLQTKYNVYLQNLNKKAELEAEWEIVKIFDKKFLEQELNIIVDKNNKEETINKMKEIFMINSLKCLKSSDMFAFCRTSVLKDIDEKQMILRNAWISYAMKISNTIECCEYNQEKLLNNIGKIRSLTLEEPEIFTPKLHKYLNEAGIKLVEIPYLKGSNVSGVTKWIPSENAIMIAINDYGKDADKIWFNIFHELGHAIKNHKRHLTISYDKNNILDQDEIDANEFAKNNLIDPHQYNEFISIGDYSIDAINRFAKKIKIANFIVIGRLQRDKIIPWSHFASYKVKYKI